MTTSTTTTRRRRSINIAPAPVITPATAFNLSLMDAGGEFWASGDATQKRVYFNSVQFGDDFIKGYFDCSARTWTVGYGQISAEDFGSLVLSKIAAGTKFF